MDADESRTEAVEQLQALGLKEYEAAALVALIRLGTGTAKAVSETSAVPRTRVYDAVRVLEAKGLVEVQHSNPQQFRPVSVTEALDTLERQYEARFASLEATLEALSETPAAAPSRVNEVWSLSNDEAIANRIERLLEEAASEVILVVGTERLFDTSLAATVRAAAARGVTVVIGTHSEEIEARITEHVPGVEVFTTELEWLEPEPGDDEASIGHMALIDRETLLVSSVDVDGASEQAVYASGVSNAFVVIARRLLLTGKVSEVLLADD